MIWMVTIHASTTALLLWKVVMSVLCIMYYHRCSGCGCSNSCSLITYQLHVHVHVTPLSRFENNITAGLVLLCRM